MDFHQNCLIQISWPYPQFIVGLVSVSGLVHKWEHLVEQISISESVSILIISGLVFKTMPLDFFFPP